MSQNLITLMTTAAELRTGGMSWEYVGQKVHRKAGTCSKWPSRYRREWNRIYMDAQRQRYEEVSNESLTYLRSLLRSKEDKTKLKSIEMTLRYGPAAIAALTEGLGAKNPEDEDKYEKWLRYQAGEDDWRRRIDRERARKGLPPATDAEFYAEWTVKLEEIQNPKILNLYFDANGCPIERPAGEPEYISKAEYDARMAKGWVKHENGNHTPAAWVRNTPPSGKEPLHPDPVAHPRSGGEGGRAGMFATSILALVGALATLGLAFGLGVADKRLRGEIVGSSNSRLVSGAHISLGTSAIKPDSNTTARSTLPEPCTMPISLQSDRFSFVRFGLVAALFGLMLDAPPHAAEPAKEVKDKGKANRLAKESSPYLLQHAHNPVDWFPWGPEAFEKAKKEKKLVFLSIGYSSCHWCHVMEKESFSNKEVADFLNANFVCIKVDREERPDIDEIYMTALHTMGTRGGWPLSMFLTADAKPIVGGTYWPREDREIDGEKVNGYKTILKMLLKVWTDKPKEIQTQADEYAEQTAGALERGIRANPILDLDRALANGAAESIRDDIDPTFGGIGSKARKFMGTKFPMPTSVGALLDYAVREKDDDLKKQIKLTLDQMLMGGIYDQLGGGFHRYSTERTWTVPHFEKMLYDNGQLVELYAEAFRQTKDPNYARVIRETLAFIQRELTSPEGGFYSALDADSNGTEGEFYVWTAEEIDKILGDKGDFALIRAIYGITGSPNFEKKFYILKLSRPFEEIAKEQNITVADLTRKLDGIKKKLFDFRAKRERPFLDTKVLTAWNGQMIAGYAKAGEVLKEPEFVKAAIKNAEFLLKNLRNKDGRLLRTWGVKSDGKSEAKLNGYLDDYAFLAHGLLNLHEATGDKKWLAEAKSLMDIVVKWHSDGDRGGYFFTSSDHEKLFARPKDYFDGAQPSANGVVARNLVRLWRITKDETYRKLAEKSFRQFAGILRSNPSGVPGMCVALHLYLDEKDAKPEKKEPKKDTPTVANPLKSEDVVKLSAAFEKRDAAKQFIKIKLVIEKPWYIYANPSGSDATAGNQTSVTLRIGGKSVEATVAYPDGALVKDKELGDYRIYEKEIIIFASLERKDDDKAPLDVQVKVQACTKGNGGRCLAPSVLKATVK